MNPISSDIFGRLSWLTKAFKNLCCKVGLLDDRVTFIEDTCCNGGGRDAPLLIEKTLEEMSPIILDASLVPGAVYKITGVWKGHYNDGTNPGTTIYLHALSNSELSKEGWGEFYNPIYQSEDDYYNEDPTGLWGIWDENNYNGNYSYQIDDVVIWGSFKWINISGSTGYAIDSQTLQSGDWAKIPYTDTDHYIKVIDYIEYDLFWDYIRRRKSIDSDNSGEERHIDVYESQSPAISAIESVAWGLRMVKNININATGSGFNIINFKGTNLEDITINNGLLAINYSNYDSRIFRINLDQSFIDISLGTDSILSDINLTNASDISGCYLGQSCNFSLLKLDGYSSIRNIEGEYFGLISLTLNNYSKIGIDQADNTGSLYLEYSDFTNITMSDHCTISNIQIYNSYIRDCQLINHSYFDSFDIFSESFITNVSLDTLSYLSNIRLSEGDYFDQLSLSYSSYINNVSLYTYCSVANCNLEQNGYINEAEFYSFSYIANIEIKNYSSINQLYLLSGNYFNYSSLNYSSNITNLTFNESAFASYLELNNSGYIGNVTIDFGSSLRDTTLSFGGNINNSQIGLTASCQLRYITITNNSYIGSITLDSDTYLNYITISNDSRVTNLNGFINFELSNVTVDNTSYINNIYDNQDGDYKYFYGISLKNSSYISNIDIQNSSFLEYIVVSDNSYIDTITLAQDSYFSKITITQGSSVRDSFFIQYSSFDTISVIDNSTIYTIEFEGAGFNIISIRGNSTINNIYGTGEYFNTMELICGSSINNTAFNGYGAYNLFLNGSTLTIDFIGSGYFYYIRMNNSFLTYTNMVASISNFTYNDINGTYNIALASKIYYPNDTKIAYYDDDDGDSFGYYSTGVWQHLTMTS